MKDNLLRLLELIKIYNDQRALEEEFKVFAADEDNPVVTIDDLVETMEVSMSYWEE